ncbi:S8 family peptidase [Streptomyces sp. NPDC058471]|uniref:S8 family peptidase n=1 Tax=Streptomyces sp. NPDC058471 TaxID=3346516 RepID=UPI00365329F0
MAGERNFLLGHGERLVTAVATPPGGATPDLPYTAEEARDRLRPQVEAAARSFEALPAEACPSGKAVGLVTLHPQFIAKTYHPGDFLRDNGLSYIGSRGVQVTPEKWTRQGEPHVLPSTELFISGRRDSFATLAERMQSPDAFPEGSPIQRIEAFRAPDGSDKKRGTMPLPHASSLFEVGLHIPNIDRDAILRSFQRWARTCGVSAELDKSIPVAGLVFMPVAAHTEELDELSKFSFLRVIRPMPRLRTLHPIERSLSVGELPPIDVPDEPVVDGSIRMAIFDGGLPSSGPMSPWTHAFDTPGIGVEVEDCLDHGHMVTSAALFGSLNPGEAAPRPYNSVDHYRILDDTGEDSYALYTALNRIRDVLEEKNYDFVNLSLGPELPIEDDEVHPWTAVLDEYLSHGQTFMTVAAGNNGASDWASGNARVQVPSDCVNALAVGSANSKLKNWDRSGYSAIGPGRSPGLVKPDVLSFGGSQYEPFIFLPQNRTDAPLSAMGTSFAAPAALRMAAGIRAHFGGHIKPLGLRALIVHCTERGDVPVDEAGWGRIPDQLEAFVVCPQNSVRVLYQGSIDPGQTVRMPIPLPEDVKTGSVTISATYCINSPTDSRSPSTYTGSAIEPVFRPHAEKFKSEDSMHPVTAGFFKSSDFLPENDLRQGAHKWETTKHKTLQKRASSLLRPVFDVRYVSRLEQLTAIPTEKVEYALVITLTSTADSDIYNKVVRAFSGQLDILQPQVDIPIAVRP